MRGKRGAINSTRFPHNVFRSWGEISAVVRGADQLILFLDFDGTLVNLRKRPEEVRVPMRVRRILRRLARHPRVMVVLVSGRRVWSLRRLLKEERVHYFGLHGAEAEGTPPSLSHRATLALGRARLSARLLLRSLPGIWIEDKGLSFAVHFRAAKPASVRVAQEALNGLLAPLRNALHVIEGDNVWEVLPIEFQGKGAAVETFMRRLPAKSVGIYIGDDATDEPAFGVLPEGITVRVGRTRGSKARFYVRNPAGVLSFLTRLERELP